MHFTHFLLLMVSATVITLLLMYLGEKIMLLITPKGTGPLVRMLGSLTFTFATLSIIMFGFHMNVDLRYFGVAVVAIILNKYWLGHFEKNNDEMKALPIHAEKIIE